MKITEHLVFAALMIPTFVVLAAAAVSLGNPDPKALTAQPAPALVAEHPTEPRPF